LCKLRTSSARLLLPAAVSKGSLAEPPWIRSIRVVFFAVIEDSVRDFVMAEAETESRRSIMMQQVCRSFARRLAVCVTLLSFAAALGAQTPAWKTYSYSEDGFSAAYPLRAQHR
jgi:hypothetical protein